MKHAPLVLQQMAAQKEQDLYCRPEHIRPNRVAMVGGVSIPVQDLQTSCELRRERERLVVEDIVD